MSLLNNDSFGFLIADISRLLRRSFERCMEGSTLTLAQARVLIYVARREGCRQVELADLLEVQPITLARLVDQLVAAGLVERRADPADRRAYQLFLTAAAAPQLDVIEQTAMQIRGEALAGLADEQADELLAALRQVRGNLSGA